MNVETEPLIYLASPYTSEDKKIEAARYEQVLVAWEWLIKFYPDVIVFSPIIQSRALCIRNAPGDWRFWSKYDQALLSRCSEFWVLCIPGWQESVGITAEQKIATELGLPIKFLTPTTTGYLLHSHEVK